MFISCAHEVNAEVASVEVGPRWGKGDGYRKKAANEVGRGGRSRRSRILIFARPRRASLTIFGWWLGPPPVLQVEPGSSSGLHTSHPLEPQNLKCPMCCPAPTVITSEPG